MADQFEVLLMADAGMPGAPPPMRPRLIRTPTRRPAPWVLMTAAEIRAAMAATDAAWRTYQASQRSPGQVQAAVILGENGTRWKIDAGGNIVPA